MAALLTYKKTEKEQTKSARSILQGVSRMIFEWSSLTEDSQCILFAEIDEALEDAEREVARVL
jgi:hypothetical protein